jgi:ribose 1,5-bisphosphate isomerase
VSPTIDEGDPAAALEQAAQRLRADHEHGASWLAREAARALGAAAGDLLDRDRRTPGDLSAAVARLRAGARALAHARPSMAALATTTARTWAAGWPAGSPAAEASDAEATRRALERIRAEAGRMVAAWDRAAGAIAEQARPLLRGTLFTHSRSGTVEQVLLSLAGQQRGEVRGVIVTESRPGGEGLATARALAAAGVRVTLVADAAVGLMVADAECVVLGADSVRPDGSLVNKVGSYPLALAAWAGHIPVYVLCETLKIAPEGWPLTLEEMNPAELLPEPVAGITARNVYFDRTPPDCITAILTEQGLMRPVDLHPLAAAAARELAALDVG